MKTLDKTIIPKDVKLIRHLEKGLIKHKNSSVTESYLPSQFYEGERVWLKIRNKEHSFINIGGSVLDPFNCIFGDSPALCIRVDKKYESHYKPHQRSYIYRFIEDAWEIE